jgi:hypothetical protein
LADTRGSVDCCKEARRRTRRNGTVIACRTTSPRAAAVWWSATCDGSICKFCPSLLPPSPLTLKLKVDHGPSAPSKAPIEFMVIGIGTRAAIAAYHTALRSIKRSDTQAEDGGEGGRQRAWRRWSWRWKGRRPRHLCSIRASRCQSANLMLLKDLMSTHLRLLTK